MEERISRTAGNVYEKWDKDVWQVISNPKNKRYTTFIDFEELILSEKRDDVDIDIETVIENIRTIPLNNEEIFPKQFTKKQ